MKRHKKKEVNREYPPGYKEACLEYPNPVWVEDGIYDIWQSLDFLDQSKKGFPRLKASESDFIWRGIKHNAPSRIARFQERIFKAVDERDLVYLKKLLKAMGSPEPSLPAINSYNARRAAIVAFQRLFTGTTREEWPTKQMVQKEAMKILNEAGIRTITDRQWPRIYRETGLSALPKGG